jgi:hypothetical protein
MNKVFNYLLIGSLVVCSCGTIWASVQTDIEQANKIGKAVFLVVTDPGVNETGQALEIARGAQKLAPESTVMEMNRSDTANRQFVAQYGLSGAPVPLILLIASNGVVAGGMPAEQARPDMLVKMIPSPGKAEVVKALTGGKAVFVIASRKSMGNRSMVLETCKNASKEMKDKAISVSIDMDDKNESSFLQQLRTDMSSTEPATFVLNAQGQVTGNFSGPVEAAQLVQATTKKAGGCCPGGSNKGCGSGNQKGK